MRNACLLPALLLSSAAWAGGAIPSCHDSHFPESGAPTRAVFVAIDQTTQLSPALQQMVADNLKRFVEPGNSFTVLVFSAYTQGHYTDVLTTVQLDPSLPAAARDDISKPLLAKFDQCLQRQQAMAAQVAGLALRSAYKGTSGGIAKSDVLASLQTISSTVQRASAPEKIVLIVSDMLENSSVANFYADHGHAVRQIDSAKELHAVEENHLRADFGGARIYVIGAGLLPEDIKQEKSYRDPKTMQALETFWRSYLTRSNANLVEFGKPALLNPVQ